jgi:hypothetical protein
MGMIMEGDYYWQSAQRLAAILGESVRVKPDDEQGLHKIPPSKMSTALSEMCHTLAFMEHDAVLYECIAETKERCPSEVRSYLHRTGMNIDEVFGRFMQFEKAVIKDTQINYDFGVIMMSAVESKRRYLRTALLSESSIDVSEIKQNVSDVRRWVCEVSDDYGQEEPRIGEFNWGRLLTIAGLKIAANNLVLGGVFIPTGHVDISVSVAAYMSEMVGGLLMMLPSRGDK